ncbi:MAG: right-handed parallel beta-helix repeat-containing protein [Candidatus Thorarchaeota archaeon]
MPTNPWYPVVSIAANNVIFKGFEIDGTGFTATSEFAGVLVDTDSVNNDLSNVVIEKNIIHNLTTRDEAPGTKRSAKGIHLRAESSLGRALYNIAISDNLIDNIVSENWGAHGIQVVDDMHNVSITDNTITNTHGAAWDEGIVVDGHSSTTTTQVSIERNTIENNMIGIMTEANSVPAHITVQNNNLENNTAQFVNNNANQIIAENNWWGNASGPDPTTISGNVDFCPWLDAAYPSGNSFYPVENTTKSTGHCSIQDAVNNANAGDTIEVAAGTYDEMILINKPLTLRGANAGIHPAVGTSTTETVGIRGPESILSHNYYAIRPAADNITIDGFKFTGAGGRIIDTYDNADNFHLTNCIFDNSTTGPTQGVIQFGGGRHVNFLANFNLFQDRGDHTFYFGGGPYDGLTLANNKFNGLGDGVFWAASPLVDGIITENEFDGTIGGTPGLGGTGLNIGQGGNIQITNNWFHDLLYTGFQVGIIGGSVTGNTFENIYPLNYNGTWYPSNALQLWGGEWGTAVSTNVTITDNTIKYNNTSNANATEDGIRLRNGVDAANIHINYNDILNQGNGTGEIAIKNQGTGTADAINNWWGQSTGPDAALFSGSVNYDPWLYDEKDNVGGHTYDSDGDDTVDTSGIPGMDSMTFDSAIPGHWVNINEYESDPTPAPSTIGFLGHYYEISTDMADSTFTVTIVFSYTEAELAAAGISEDDDLITVTYWDGTAWQPIAPADIVWDKVANTVTVTLNHFTPFSIIAATTIEVNDITPDTAKNGEDDVGIIDIDVLNGAAFDDKFDSLTIRVNASELGDIEMVKIYKDRDNDGVFEPGADDGAPIRQRSTINPWGNKVVFNNFNQIIPAGTEQHFFVAFDIMASAFNGNTVDAWIKAGEAVMLNAGSNTIDLDPAGETTIITNPQATINLYYSALTNNLRVWGNAPDGTSYAVINVVSIDNNLLFIYAPISIDENNEYDYLIDVSAFDLVKYNIVVQFYNANGDFISEVGGFFDNLYVIWIEDRVTTIEGEINTLQTDLSDLETRVANNEIDIDAAEAAIQSLETRMNTAENEIGFIQTEIIGMQLVDVSLQAQIDALNDRLTDLETTVIPAIEADIAQLRSDLDLMNHGTIWLVYNEGAQTLRVKGEAPLGTAYVLIKVYDKDNVHIPAYDVIANFNPTTNFYKTIPDYDISGWTPQIYNIKAIFYDASDAKVDKPVTTIFSALAIKDLQGRVSQLESDVSDLQEDIADLEERVATNEENIAILQAQMADLQARMDQAEADIANLYGEVADLHAMDEFLQAQIDDLDNRLTFLEEEVIPSILARLDSIEAMIERMNHGTINLHYNGDPVNILYVWGEMPEGTQYIDIVVTDIYGLPISGSPFSGISIDQETNEYEAFLGTENWAPLKYNILVNFYESEGGTKISYVGDLFDNLYMIWIDQRVHDIETIEIPRINEEIQNLWDANAQQAQQIIELQTQLNDLNNELTQMINDLNTEMQAKIANLQAQINTLNEQLARMNHGTINIAFNASNDYMRVWGEAPEGTTAMEYYVLNEIGEYVVPNVALAPLDEYLDPNTNKYEFDLYTTGWNSGTFTVFVLFDSGEVAESFTKPFFGFSNVSTSNRVETFFVPYAEVPIDYCIKVPTTGLYSIIITDDSHFTQVLRNTTLNGNKLYCFNNSIVFGELGSWELRLELWERDGEEALYSFEPISIEVIGLESYIEDSTITITAPTPNVEDIYWTNADTVFLSAVLGENAPTEDHYCDVFYETDNDLTEPLARLPIMNGEGGKYCQGNFRTSQLLDGTVGVYRIGVEAEFQAGMDAVDYAYIGYENIPPVIEEIVDPGYISGIVILQARVTDPHSGVLQVWMSIQDKDTGQLLWTAEAFFNPATGYYEVDFDSTQEDPSILDGPYNIYVRATDIAGNEAVGYIDPIIDNTPPTIEDWSMSPENPVRGETISFHATASDDPAGISSVKARIIDPQGNEYYSELTITKRTKTNFNWEFEGTMDTNNDFAAGNCNAAIVVKDHAGNTGIADENFELGKGTKREGNGNETIIWPESASVKKTDYNSENSYFNFWLEGNSEQWIKVLLNGEWVTIKDLNIDGNMDVKVLPSSNIILTIQNASVTSLNWNSGSKELSITADGNGTQEVVVYVNGNGNPKKILFDGQEISSWTYDATEQTVTFTIDLGSPHEILLSWYSPPKQTTPPTQPSGGGGPSGGGRSAYTCGDGECNDGENYCSCPSDCEKPECNTCEEVNCESGEPVCSTLTPCEGNGICEEGENCESVPMDCKCEEGFECKNGECVALPVCGDGICQDNESPANCAEDCGSPVKKAPVKATPTATPIETKGTPTTASPIATPSAPTGLFGFGLLGDSIAGILIAIIVIAGIAYFYFSGKKTPLQKKTGK